MAIKTTSGTDTHIAKNGVSDLTPNSIVLGAGTIHKGMVLDTENGLVTDWGTIIGATSGGNSVEIKGEIVNIELDGALVKTKGLAVMQGGTATMECNFAEITEDIVKMGIIGTSTDGVGIITPKAVIEEDDYVPGFAFVGLTADGIKRVIVWFENALCTSGLKLEGKNKENSVISLTMEAYAEINGNLDTIPVKILMVDDMEW